ncbi:MAG TPA: cobalt-precorrin-7 (C(5))-methyltransferase [Methanosarcinaceae archaeon]|nr:cobalt-precorrin-7 (C(5))-methyltransferase [Methanosarcinaceae archaeon]
MIIVGVGVGPGMLTQEATEAIQGAPVIYGSGRAIELASKYIRCEARKIGNYKTLHLLQGDAVVLSTGDPMFSGLGKFAGEKDKIIPGISSLQVACSRIGVNLTDLAVITAHGRDPAPAKEALVQELRLGKNIFMLPDASLGTNEVAAVLGELKINAQIYACERLGYPDEHISNGDVNAPPIVRSDLYCLMIVR